jgi:hypothetical protein
MFLTIHVFTTDSIVAPIGIDGQGGMRLTFGTKAHGIRIRTKKGNKVCNYPVKTGAGLDWQRSSISSSPPAKISTGQNSAHHHTA